MTDNTTIAINKLISDKVRNVLEGVSLKFGISEGELEEFMVCENEKQTKKFSGKQCEQCMGRKQDGKQCTRKRKPGKEFCGKHENNRRYGRIDDDNNIIIPNNSDIIRFVKTKINGSDYLVDSNKNVIDYTDIECPEFIGTYNGSNIVKCF